MAPALPYYPENKNNHKANEKTQQYTQGHQKGGGATRAFCQGPHLLVAPATLSEDI